MNLEFILDKIEISFNQKCNEKVKKAVFFLERKIDISDFVHNQWKEEPSLKVSFLVMSVREKESKFQNTAFLLVKSGFIFMHWHDEKKYLYKLGLSLVDSKNWHFFLSLKH